MKKKSINIALVCTAGGHFEQLTNLSDFYNQYHHFWLTNKNKQTVSQLTGEKKYFIKSAHYKKPWTYLSQILATIKIFIKEKPTHVISTGSGRTAFVPFLLARFLKVKFLHIDTFSRVFGYSKFGTFLLRTGHQIYTQWDDSDNNKVEYIGPILKKVANFSKKSNPSHVFVAVGTREEPFLRLIKCVEDLIKRGTIKERVIVQAGHAQYTSKHLELFDFCTPQEIDDLILNAKYVITQESAGIGTKCLKYNTEFIVMPRDYKYGELPAKSDMNEDLHLKLEEMGYTKVVDNLEELAKAVSDIEKLKTGFSFDNSLAIATLTKKVEGS